MVKSSTTKNRNRKRIPVPLVLNILLLLMAFGAFLGLSRMYQTRLHTISAEENRFVTMEWELLQEYKRQTDLKLLEKDREIADLRRQYRQLVQQNASESTLQELELRITIAGSERETIAVNDAADEVKTTALASLFSEKGGVPADPVSITTLMATQIETLSAQLQERQLYARMLQEQLVSAGMEPQPVIPGEEREWQEKDRQLRAYKEALNDAKRVLDGTEDLITRNLLEEQSKARKPVENLETWVLLRAIASSPAIRSEYPDLSTSMNRYLESFAEKERAAGRTEAFREVLNTIKPLEEVLGN